MVWGDAMKLGLRGPGRRVWTPRGGAVSQAMPIGWQDLYVAVALDPLTGRRWGTWQQHRKGEERARIGGVWAEAPAIAGGVGDGAGGHTGQAMPAVDAPRVVPPPYAPERNPGARVFRELRRAGEGRVDPDLQAQQEALEPIRQAWQADPQRVQKLCGGDWLRKALTHLPATPETP